MSGAIVACAFGSSHVIGEWGMANFCGHAGFEETTDSIGNTGTICRRRSKWANP